MVLRERSREMISDVAESDRKRKEMAKIPETQFTFWSLLVRSCFTSHIFPGSLPDLILSFPFLVHLPVNSV